MTLSISLVTPTHDRPEAFALCEKYIDRQTLRPAEWIVVDDGTEPAHCTLNQRVIRLPTENNPRESFRKNYLAALREVTTDCVLFIEDDDWYASDYIEKMNNLLQTRMIVGQSRPRFYNVRHRTYRVHDHSIHHASLCQTGIDKRLVPQAMMILEDSPTPERLDGTLWRRSRLSDRIKRLEPNSTRAVGIKGMYDRRCGIEHSQRELVTHKQDSDGSVLRSWIGDDADVYLKMFPND